MRKIHVFSTLTLGVTSIASQLILIRELVMSFFGNEFFLGWIFASWLFWAGIGSLVLTKITKINNPVKSLFYCHLLAALFLPLAFFLVRFSRNLVTISGQIPDLISSLGYAFAALAPLGLVLGLQFVVLGKFLRSTTPYQEYSRSVSQTYIWEVVGFAIGGLAFSYFLVTLNELLVALLIGTLNLAAAFLLIRIAKETRPLLEVLLILSIFIFAALFGQLQKINNLTNSWRYPHQKLVETKNTIYANLAVTKTESQYNFYDNGLLVATSTEDIHQEHLAHLPLLCHSAPRRALLVGGGTSGMIKEMLKHNPEEVIYLEIDPEFIETVREHIPPEQRQYLEDKRVNIIYKDVRYYLKDNKEKFDVMIVNLPNPSTALINRFFSQDFFREARNHLADDGIFSTHLNLPADYLDRPARNLDASILQALKKEFSQVLFLPDRDHLFIASDNLECDSEIVAERWKERSVTASFATPEYLDYRFTNDRIQKIAGSIERDSEVKTNEDQLPVSYYYNFTHWVLLFYPRLATLFEWAGKVRFSWLIFFLIAIAILSLLLRKNFKGRLDKVLLTAMAAAGFSLMAVELLLILGFETFYGFQYYKIALIITAVMVGMALGSWLAVRKVKNADLKHLIGIHCLLTIFIISLLAVFYLFFKMSTGHSAFLEIVFLLSALLIGATVGFEFPLINDLYLKQKKSFQEERRSGGTIYALDIFGSCAGAFLTGIILLPAFGFCQTLILLATANTITILLLYLKSFSN